MVYLTTDQKYWLKMFDEFFKLTENDIESRVENNKENYIATIETPGFDEKDINIEINGRKLEISAEHKESPDNKYLRQKLYKSFLLPKNINEAEIKASLKNGILSIIIPKLETSEPRKIKIN